MIAEFPVFGLSLLCVCSSFYHSQDQSEPLWVTGRCCFKWEKRKLVPLQFIFLWLHSPLEGGDFSSQGSLLHASKAKLAPHMPLGSLALLFLLIVPIFYVCSTLVISLPESNILSPSSFLLCLCMRRPFLWLDRTGRCSFQRPFEKVF